MPSKYMGGGKGWQRPHRAGINTRCRPRDGYPRGAGVGAGATGAVGLAAGAGVPTAGWVAASFGVGETSAPGAEGDGDAVGAVGCGPGVSLGSGVGTAAACSLVPPFMVTLRDGW